MTAPLGRPTLPEVLPLLKALYEKHAAGCCLHIVLDDCNLKNQDVIFCRSAAIEAGHLDCLHLAEKLLLMTISQRARLARAR